MKRRNAAAAVAGLVLSSTSLADGIPAPAPTLRYAFTVRAELVPPVEQGTIDGGRRRFIAITGGQVYGPSLAGVVLAGGGDWQTILPNGLTKVEAHYFLQASDGAVIEVTNRGVRTATPDVIEKLAKSIDVDPSAYYFRTTPHFAVANGPHDWLNRHAFVARGIRKPDHVLIDFYEVE